MRNLIRIVLLCSAVLALSANVFGGPDIDVAVYVSAEVQTIPPRIRVHFPPHANNPGLTTLDYTIYRKSLQAQSWGEPIGTVTPPETYFDDYAVAVGQTYEYRVERRGNRTVTPVGPFTARGYVATALEGAAVHNPGKVILLVDSTIAADTSTELRDLQDQLLGDGWTVLRHDVPRGPILAAQTPEAYAQYVAANALAVRRIRALVQAEYEADPQTVRAVLLFGHVAVPYSGLWAIDGHPDHVGAWASDLFYSDIQSILGVGGWSDAQVNYDSYWYENKNVPGDGKFDQNSFPAELQLMVGRIDMARLPVLAIEGETNPEVRLLKRYVEKAKKHRTLQIPHPQLALVNPFDPYRTPLHYTQMKGLFGNAGPHGVGLEEWNPNVLTGPNHHAILIYNTWGGFDRWDYIGTTETFKTLEIHAAFMSVFASYSGDWDRTDNIARASLSGGNYLLTCDYTPGPTFHPMAIGYPVGWTVNHRANNNATYQLWGRDQSSRTSLLGDPTLRLHVLPPVTHVEFNPGNSTLVWTPPGQLPPGFLGYFVYQGETRNGPFHLVNSVPTPFSQMSFSGATLATPFMVRVAARQQTPSGTYTNLSLGKIWTGNGSLAPVIATQPRGRLVTAGETVALTVGTLGSGTLSYTWYRNGFPIATTPHLVIDDFQLGNDGSYHVVVANAHGTVTSDPVNLQFYDLAAAPIPPLQLAEGGSGVVFLEHNGILLTNIVSAAGYAVADPMEDSVTFTADPGEYGNHTITAYLADSHVSEPVVIQVQIADASIQHGLPGMTPVTYSETWISPGESRVLPGNVWELRSNGGFAAGPNYAETLTMEGNFEVKVRLDQIDGDSNFGAFAGLVILESADPGARYALLGLTPDRELLALDHDFTVHYWGSFPALPVWLKMRREGDLIRFYSSTDGSTWTAHPETIVLPGLGNQVLAGMNVSGQNGNGRSRARGLFTNFGTLAGLISVWHADGNALDSAGNNHGIAKNGASYTAGILGQGFALDGIDDYIRILDSPSLHLSEEVSVELWFKRASDLSLGGLFDKRSMTHCNYGIHFGANNNLSVYYNDPNHFGYEHSTTPANSVGLSGIFHHLVATYRQTSANAVEINVFVDGEIVATATQPGSLAATFNSDPLAIGTLRDGLGGSFFEGVIDEVSLHRFALHPVAVRERYQKLSSLVSLWHADGNPLDAMGDNAALMESGVAFTDGARNQGFRFDGVNDKIRVYSNPSMHFSGSFTIDFWFKQASAQNGTAFFDMSTSSTRAYAVLIGADNNAIVYHGNQAYPTPAQTLGTLGQFHHLAATFNVINTSSVEVKTYVDGTLMASDTQAVELNGGYGDLMIGAIQDGVPGSFFHGIIDEVALHHRALSAGEVAARFQSVALYMPSSYDSDDDGLTDDQEIVHGTDLFNGDSDTDGLPDGYEVATFGIAAALDPNNAGYDADGDTLNNLEEFQAGTNPLHYDTDGDEFFDNYELAYGTNPLAPDTDGDGLEDDQEVWGYPSSDPLLYDTDGDGAGDGTEINCGSDPNVVDSDGDMMWDGFEIYYWGNHYSGDPYGDDDGDTFVNVYEFWLQSNPFDYYSPGN